MINTEPNYIKIFSDIISKRFPQKLSHCQHFLQKERLSSLDIITLNSILFSESDTNNDHKSYDKESIAEILNYQKKTKMNNSEVASIFKISRNTLAIWKKTMVKK
ncbi:helix-turn-helix domain-containing protein [Chryseobacterium sp. BIGb0232]|uniref:helix-turn-helix domain-containing protein n=1 Tax=Chryseobacterium sp. BIGb0232 TaxID=2940598 RepID=UPI000F48A06F|nr:helix-turn-helix domain-containing protein [Chryseobacterium sp. BIGb0232]MCS4301177.1 DNA-binding transcriptional regulator YiaG [Chryseobacterium sp. BIGb0232]ROS19962.1 hypothetical protein EDF65_0662 [Chryseobacterium nakagawai]